MDKDIRINLDGLKMLDERMLAALIDSLVEHYTNNFGLDSLSDIPEPPPSKPQYDCEDLSIAKEYLKKYRL
jgi:hypothetical protein